MFKWVLFDDFESMLLQKLKLFTYFFAKIGRKILLNCKYFLGQNLLFHSNKGRGREGAEFLFYNIQQRV